MLDWNSFSLVALGAIIPLGGIVIENLFYKRNFKMKKTEIFYSKQIEAIEKTNDLFTQFLTMSSEISHGFNTMDKHEVVSSYYEEYFQLVNKVISYTNGKLIFINAINNGDKFDETRLKMNNLFEHFGKMIINSDYEEKYILLYEEYSSKLDEYAKEITAYYTDTKNI